MDTAPDLTATEVIDRVREARRAEQAASFEQLELAVAWALLHPCPAGAYPAHWGEPDLHTETVTPLAGQGAPWVAEFAPADLGAALGITLDAAKQLIGDALELTYRLPGLRDLAATGKVAVWRARQVAQHTRDLTPQAAAHADRLICATPNRLHQVDVGRLAQEARLYHDPDRAIADEEEALARRGVWLRHGYHGPATTEVLMTLDTPDAQLLDATLTRIAADLRALGDPDPLDIRRARAAGILADPQHALDLMSGREGAAPTQGVRTGTTNLYLHLTPDDLAADTTAGTAGGTGAVTIERLGAATTRLLTDWLTRHAATGTKITVRPVLDPDHLAAVDQHDPPEPMREAVLLRDAHCVFPGCRRDSRSCDLDHITEYLPMEDGGPPGQTDLDNLAPLCRTHHRVKTHSAWRYKRLDTGTYTWTSPTSHQYTVTPTPRLPRSV